MVEHSTSQNWGQNRPPKATTLAYQNFLHHSTRSDPCPTQFPRPPARDSRFHLRDWRYGAISVGALVSVRSDSPTLNAMEPPPSFHPTPRRYGNGRREAWPTHPAAAADMRYPPRERRAGTPSWGGAILGSLCPKSRQMTCLSSSLHSQRKKYFYSSPSTREINANRPQPGAINPRGSPVIITAAFTRDGVILGAVEVR